MLNQIVLVGRLTRDPEVIETENGNKVANITLAVPRTYKNMDGVYDTDFITVTLWREVAQNTAEYVQKGDLVGIKGRMQTESFEKDGNKEFRLNVVAEKVTFLSSRDKNSQEKSDISHDER